MAVKIRMKKMGRKHRPFFRICAADTRSPRDGKVIEELGTYDPMVKETDARAQLKTERIDYWLSVGAQPSVAVRTLIKKYGTNGTHLEAQQEAMARLQIKPQAPAAVAIALPEKEEAPAADAKAEAPAADAPADDAAKADAPAEEKAEEKKEEAAPAEDAKAEEPKAEEAKADEPKAEEAPAEEKKEQ